MCSAAVANASVKRRVELPASSMTASFKVPCRYCIAMRQAEARRGHFIQLSQNRMHATAGHTCRDTQHTAKGSLRHRALEATAVSMHSESPLDDPSPIDRVTTVQQSIVQRKASGPVVYGVKFQYPAPSSILPVGL